MSSFLKKYKKPIKNKIKTLLQANLLSNETDIFEDDDPVSKTIPHQKSQQSQSSHVNHSLLAEIKHYPFNDSHLSDDILINLKTIETLKSDDKSVFLLKSLIVVL